ncbi:MAG TPA: hypothetical protein VH020_14135 [Stellaceae bacterium]|jgi:nucleoid-associated protein YgaU|nr:hypothetical protein [Stellaceae bacterium]
MRNTSTFLTAAAFLLTAALPALAQDKAPPAPPTRLRATIEKVDNGTLTVKTEQGQDATVTVMPKTNISGVAARKLSDIKPNEFIGITAMNGKDGVMHATEVHIFPEPMRGAGEGHYPWDKGPDSSMTNAAVAGMVDSSDGKLFTMSYKDKKTGKTGEVKIDIGPTVPIVAFVPGDPSLLKPGAKTVMFAHKNPDGTYMALGIVAEKDGVKPPM